MTDRQSTHGQDCWGWGPRHYECAVAEIGRLREELSKMRGAEPSDEEINATIGKHFQLPGNACRAHAAIAEVLRAQPAASAEPSDEEIRSEQVRRMAEDAARYAIARRMSPQQWADAWELNHRTGKPFDEIIDDLAPFFGAAVAGREGEG